VVANHYRTDHDLSSHAKGSSHDLSVLDDGEKVIPFVWEASMGIDRTLFAVIDNAYAEQKVKGETRKLLQLKPTLAPYSVAVFPLLARDKLPQKAQAVYAELSKSFDTFYDEKGSIGKRYRRQDETGTPFCVTIDHQTLKDSTATVRKRDSMKQKRVKINKLADFLSKIMS